MLTLHQTISLSVVFWTSTLLYIVGFLFLSSTSLNTLPITTQLHRSWTASHPSNFRAALLKLLTLPPLPILKFNPLTSVPPTAYAASAAAAKQVTATTTPPFVAPAIVEAAPATDWSNVLWWTGVTVGGVVVVGLVVVAIIYATPATAVAAAAKPVVVGGTAAAAKLAPAAVAKGATAKMAALGAAKIAPAGAALTKAVVAQKILLAAKYTAYATATGGGGALAAAALETLSFKAQLAEFATTHEGQIFTDGINFMNARNYAHASQMYKTLHLWEVQFTGHDFVPKYVGPGGGTTLCATQDLLATLPLTLVLPALFGGAILGYLLLSAETQLEQTTCLPLPPTEPAAHVPLYVRLYVSSRSTPLSQTLPQTSSDCRPLPVKTSEPS